MWLGLTTLDWTIIVAALVAIAALGVYMSRRINDDADFFMGGRRTGKLFMIFFSFASGTSGDDAVGTTAGTWRTGLAGIWWTFLWLWATPFYWLVGPILRRMRALTTADFFQARYDTSTATLYAVYGILMTIAMLAGGLFGSGHLINALTGGELNTLAEQLDWHVPKVFWDPATSQIAFGTHKLQGNELAVLVITILFVAYGMAGGLNAAIITDFVQGLMTIVFSFILLPWIFIEIGGFSGLQAHGEVRQGMFELFGRDDVALILGREPITMFYVTMLGITAIVGVVVQPQIMSMCGAGKTELESRLGFTYGHLLKRFCTIAWTFIGLAGLVWYLTPSISPLSPELLDQLNTNHPNYDAAVDRRFGDGLFGRIAHDLLPSGLLGLLVVSALAATMSTADTRMLASSALFTENIYKRFLRPDQSDRHYLWTGRIAALVIVAMSLILQMSFTDIVDAIKFTVKTIAPIGLSFWIGITWRGWTPAAVWVSSLSTYGMWILCSMMPQLFSSLGEPIVVTTVDGLRVSDSWTMLFYLNTGVITGVATSLVTPRPPEEKLDAFFRLIRTPVREGETVVAPCTLPMDPEPELKKLINHRDIEVPRPTGMDIGGFVLAWVFVGIIVLIPYMLSR